MTGHVFVSYSRADRGYVADLVAHVTAAGVSVWIDAELDYGDRWEAVVRDQIDSCAVFVPVMSPQSQNSALAKILGSVGVPSGCPMWMLVADCGAISAFFSRI